MEVQTIVALCAGGIVFLSLVLHVRVVPARRALVVERLGKYRRTLEAGFHVLIPYLAIAAATAAGLSRIAEAVRAEGGHDALVLRTAEEYIGALERLAAKSPEVVLPVDLTDIRSITQMVRKALEPG